MTARTKRRVQKLDVGGADIAFFLQKCHQFEESTLEQALSDADHTAFLVLDGSSGTEEQNMEFRMVVPDDYEAVRQFLSEVGWQHRVANAQQFKKMLDNTNRMVIAIDGSRIVGFARALCDEVSNGYISMVAVSVDKRGQGIGRELVRRLIKDDVGITWILRVGRESDGFWEKMGFKKSEVALERVRG